MGYEPIIIIGAGPAGLTAAYELVNRGIQPIIIEKSHKVGGLARTEVHKGYRFDIGGHRFLTKLKEVQELWHKISGKEFIKVPRRSRIYYLKHDRCAIREISVQGPQRLIQISAKNIISSMALSELIPRFSPLPPEEVLEAATKLTYRAFTGMLAVENILGANHNLWELSRHQEYLEQTG